MTVKEAIDTIKKQRQEAFAIKELARSLGYRAEQAGLKSAEKSASLRAIRKINGARIKDDAIAALAEEGDSNGLD